ncbi:hypothetical protein BDV37DRAFT_44240 [Aspergillus pseudonomiae]|uniref:Uncharacterized protein n=1 Tax=Aspergillus pseudonomiae TaxID=1506151 RepID=A0A5N7CWE5_9EURO|nr:uncharacterized protein BDV37DRAFT_44240 [Aspergillus pseudonomiae]KAE8397898.1 hypothetical protein BDV37DRAFT_44240 [Aspergillus pseudonomiae]
MALTVLPAAHSHITPDTQMNTMSELASYVKFAPIHESHPFHYSDSFLSHSFLFPFVILSGRAFLLPFLKVHILMGLGGIQSTYTGSAKSIPDLLHYVVIYKVNGKGNGGNKSSRL